MTGTTYTKQVYKNVPFKYVLRKKGYYDNWGFSLSSESIVGVGFTSYSGLTLSSEQLSGSPLTVKIATGELPVRYAYCSETLGCLKTAGQSYSVLKSGYYNFTAAGTPTVNHDTGKVSGFSASNYLTFTAPDLRNADSWEMYAKFKMTTGGKFQFFYHGQVAWGLDDSNRMHIWGVPTEMVSTFTFSTNVDYWVKLEFTGTQYLAYYKTSEDASWTTIITITSSTKKGTTSTPAYIGLNPNTTSEYFYGILDLSGYLMKVNGSTWWSPVGSTSTTAIGLLPSGVTDDGSAQTWNLFYNDGVFLLDKVEKKNGYSWCGTISIPLHSV